MKKFHIAIAVNNIDDSVVDYSKRLQAAPVVVVADEYALWRTETINFSIRQTKTDIAGVRHIGWEVETAESFAKTNDINGIEWEEFTAGQQAEEIMNIWPQSDYKPV